MKLRPYADDDLWLAQALKCDPAVMKHLGGPISRDEIPRIHRRRVQSVANGVWYFAIIPDEESGAVGTVGIWETDWEGITIHESGWVILPAFQGRGLASKALGLVLARAQADGGFAHVHAFPSVSNQPSNAICRKFGFSLLGECSVDYEGRVLRSNHWRLDLADLPVHVR